MALKCPKCGEDNPKTNRFCDSCGSKLNAGDSVAVATAVAGVEKSAQAHSKVVRRPLAPAGGGGVLPWFGREFIMDRESLWFLGIVLVGAFLRIWGLGDKPLHHDESIHAWYSLRLFLDSPAAYKYDPAYHGPFLYHANALMYFLFGTSDFASRILPAAFGIAMLIFCWQWRGLLGRTGAMVATALYAVSPTVTYVSRFIRDDIYMALSCLVMVWSLFRFFEQPERKYLYWFTAGLVVSFTSMEATWIFSGILASFLITRWLWERFSNQVEEENHVHRMIQYLLAPANRAALWIMAAIFFIPFTLLSTSLFTNADGWFIGLFDSLAYWMGEQKTGRADQPVYFYLCLLAMYELGTCFFGLVGGLRIFFGSGKPQLFLLKILGGTIPFIIALMIIVNFPKAPGMLPVLALLSTLGSGIIAYCTFAPEKGNFFKVFLLYWSILALCMFTMAGERMPWLTLHPLTPLTLLAALYIGEFFEREPNLAEHWIGLGLLWVPLAYFLVMTPATLVMAIKQAPGEIMGFLRDVANGGRHGNFVPSGWDVNLWNNGLLRSLPIGLFILAFLLTPLIIKKYSFLKRWTRGIWLALLLVAIGGLLHGTNNLLFYGAGANPAEQLVYVQSSTEIPKLQERLAKMSTFMTGGMDMKIGVEDLCSWPLSWYLRDFKNAQIGFRPPLTADQVKDYPVVITAFDTNPPAQPDHDSKVEASFKDNYTPLRMKLRVWWGPNKDAILGGDVSTGDALTKLWKLYAYRQPWLAPNPSNDPNFSKDTFGIQSPLGSYDMCVWVRKDVEKYFW